MRSLTTSSKCEALAIGYHTLRTNGRHGETTDMMVMYRERGGREGSGKRFLVIVYLAYNTNATAHMQ